MKYGQPVVRKPIPEATAHELDVAMKALATSVADGREDAGPEVRFALELPHYADCVPAGQPASTDAGIADYVDLHDVVGARRGADFVVTVTGESMVDAGILPGDLLCVRRCDDARHGDVVLADVDGGVTVKRLVIENGAYVLRSENAAQPDFADLVFSDGLIRGVVCGVVRSL